MIVLAISKLHIFALRKITLKKLKILKDFLLRFKLRELNFCHCVIYNSLILLYFYCISVLNKHIPVTGNGTSVLGTSSTVGVVCAISILEELIVLEY